MHARAHVAPQASADLADFTTQPFFPSYGAPRDAVLPNSTCRYSAIVGGVGLKNVSLTGGGVLDGMGYVILVFGCFQKHVIRPNTWV